MWILLVEDEKQLAGPSPVGLQEEEHVVEVIHGGKEAELQGMVSDYDVIPFLRRFPKLLAPILKQQFFYRPHH